MKLWSGRFSKETSDAVDDFNSSIHFDQRLYKEDIKGSIEHARMLGKQKIIPYKDANEIISGLKEIIKDIENGRAKLTVKAEDIHMNIETLLIEKIGNVAKKLHTARSRNDQVALDMRMYAKKQIVDIHLLIEKLVHLLIDISKENKQTIMPGYTHLQKAQPITLAHHLMAYVFKFIRDMERLEDAYKRTDVMPLGSGALATSTYKLDRKAVMENLGFSEITYNSLDAVSDRDFLLEIMSSLSIHIMHLSRFSEEIILWASCEFSFIELDDSYSTGSSIMPQKKNPDVAELVRGKSGRVFGNLMGLLTTMKGLPLAYNKDMQEDKESFFDTVDTIKMCLLVFTEMIKTAKFNKDKMNESVKTGYINATDLADYLVGKDIPFREAHEIVGKVVSHCLSKNKSIENLTIDEFKSFNINITSDVYDAINIKNCVENRTLEGGPSEKSVIEAIDYATNILNKIKFKPRY